MGQNKQDQLIQARLAGFPGGPATVITNDVDAARCFSEEMGQVVVAPLAQSIIARGDTEGRVDVPVMAAELTDAAGSAACNASVPAARGQGLRDSVDRGGDTPRRSGGHRYEAFGVVVTPTGSSYSWDTTPRMVGMRVWECGSSVTDAIAQDVAGLSVLAR